VVGSSPSVENIHWPINISMAKYEDGPKDIKKDGGIDNINFNIVLSRENFYFSRKRLTKRIEQ
jgi:hypothetical protein